mmetsp:Transcript_46975/g.106529  ORF Transcript_46975/g.106529 Transcript_46975/m.106529 type:complete len:185 (-) Transcript_46975:7-561(-)
MPVNPGPLESRQPIEHLSVGTELHGINCKPCSFVNTKTGCLNGSACTFCHAQHQRKSRARPSKATRTHFKNMVTMLSTVFGEDDEGLEEASQFLASKNAYMGSIFRAKARGGKDGDESVTTTTTRSEEAKSISGTSQSGSSSIVGSGPHLPAEVGRMDVGGKGQGAGKGGYPATKKGPTTMISL